MLLLILVRGTKIVYEKGFVQYNFEVFCVRFLASAKTFQGCYTFCFFP